MKKILQFGLFTLMVSGFMDAYAADLNQPGQATSSASSRIITLDACSSLSKAAAVPSTASALLKKIDSTDIGSRRYLHYADEVLTADVIAKDRSFFGEVLNLPKDQVDEFTRGLEGRGLFDLAKMVRLFCLLPGVVEAYESIFNKGEINEAALKAIQDFAESRHWGICGWGLLKSVLGVMFLEPDYLQSQKLGLCTERIKQDPMSRLLKAIALCCSGDSFTPLPYGTENIKIRVIEGDSSEASSFLGHCEVYLSGNIAGKDDNVTRETRIFVEILSRLGAITNLKINSIRGDCMFFNPGNGDFKHMQVTNSVLSEAFRKFLAECGHIKELAFANVLGGAREVIGNLKGAPNVKTISYEIDSEGPAVLLDLLNNLGIPLKLTFTPHFLFDHQDEAADVKAIIESRKHLQRVSFDLCGIGAPVGVLSKWQPVMKLFEERHLIVSSDELDHLDVGKFGSMLLKCGGINELTYTLREGKTFDALEKLITPDLGSTLEKATLKREFANHDNNRPPFSSSLIKKILNCCHNIRDIETPEVDPEGERVDNHMGSQFYTESHPFMNLQTLFFFRNDDLFVSERLDMRRGNNYLGEQTNAPFSWFFVKKEDKLNKYLVKLKNELVNIRNFREVCGKRTGILMKALSSIEMVDGGIKSLKDKLARCLLLLEKYSASSADIYMPGMMDTVEAIRKGFHVSPQENLPQKMQEAQAKLLEFARLEARQNSLMREIIAQIKEVTEGTRVILEKNLAQIPNENSLEKELISGLITQVNALEVDKNFDPIIADLQKSDTWGRTQYYLRSNEIVKFSNDELQKILVAARRKY